MKKLSQKTLILLGFFLLLIFYWSVRPDPLMDILKSQDMEKAPEIHFQNLSGEFSKLSDHQGKVVLLSFWAAWCAPCIHEMPSLISLYRKLRHKDFTIVSVNIDENPKIAIPRVLREFGMPFPILFEKIEGEFFKKYNLSSLPYNILISKSGEILMEDRGSRKWDSPKVLKILNDLLDGKLTSP